MPTYQYSCTECNHAFDQVQTFSDDSLTVCPRCEGRLRKIFNAIGVVFKGSGFYRTDNRAEAKSAASAAPTGASDSSSGESTSGESSSTTSTPTESSSSTSDKSSSKAPAKAPAGAA